MIFTGIPQLKKGAAVFLLAFLIHGCILIGKGPSPRMLRKNPELRHEDPRVIYPDSLLKKEHKLEFSYRNIEEIKLSWKMVAGIRLKSSEIGRLKELVKSNVTQYWQYRYPNAQIIGLALENMSVMDAQILISEGYPLLLYSAYDIRHRGKEYSFEGYDICVGYRGLFQPGQKNVSFKLNSGLRGYIDGAKMLTGSLFEVPKLKNSRVQVLQVLVMVPPRENLETVHQLLKSRYKRMGISNFTLPIADVRQPVGSIR